MPEIYQKEIPNEIIDCLYNFRVRAKKIVF